MSASKSHDPADIINSEVLATCSSLGYLEEDTYHKDPDCIECLKDLIRFLRNDNATHDVRRELSAVNVLQTDLLPIICQFHDDDEMLFDATLRLLVNLTNPALLLYQEELPADKATRVIYLELVSGLQKYKKAFADSKVWTVLTKKLRSLLEKDPDNHDENDKLIMERILILIRNVLNISSGPDDQMRTDDDVCVHDQVIWAVNVSEMADLLIYIAANEDEQQFCFHIIEIISQMFRDLKPSQIAITGDCRSSIEKRLDTDELEKARAREQTKISNSAKQYARFPRFGSTYQVKNYTSISDKDLIYHNYTSTPEHINLSATKQKRRTPKNRRPMEEVDSNRRSTGSVRKFLRDFCADFLDNAYNTFMGVLKDHLSRGRAQENDETYYFWAINYFMEFNRLYHFDVSRISETLSLPMFHYIHTQLEHYYEMMAVEKKQVMRWSRRLHLGLKAYHEIFMTLATMDAHPDKQIQESAKVIKGNIFYTSEYRDLLHHLLVVYDPVKFPKSYLKDLVETVHIFVRMLEQYCKVHKHVIVQKKNKKRKKSSKKGKSKDKSDISPEELLQKLWDEIADEISTFLKGTVEVSNVSPFDPTLEVTEDKHKALALVKIQTSMREKRIEESIALLKASRELWPEGELFGKLDSLPEQEFLSLREIFFTALEGAPEFPAKEPEEEQEDKESEDSEDNDEELASSSVRISEQEFNFFDFVKRFANPKVVQSYADLLANYQKNDDFTNKAILKMMHRIAWDMKMYGLFYQASLFRTFQKILADPTRNTHPSIKELARFATFIVGKFFETSAKNKKVFMEMFFWKNAKEVYEIQEGYGSFENDGGAGKKGAWSEEQDEELKMLYDEYQTLGETDKDVIDYIAEKLIDSSKTHRQILRRLKLLDIVIRKPKATRAPKEWAEEEVSQLRELFEEHKSSADILSGILVNLRVVRPKKRVVDKLIELGLVGDRKELRKKRTGKRQDGQDAGKKNKKSKTKKKSQKNLGFEGLEGLIESNAESEKSDDGSSSDERSEDDEDLESTREKRSVAVPLDVRRLIGILSAVVQEDMKPALSWIRMSLENAVEDQEDGEEPEAVPLVPIVDSHNKAMNLPIFIELLEALGLNPPDNVQERYWRIPSHLSVYQLKSRIQVIEKAERGQLLLDINPQRDGEGDQTNDRPRSEASFSPEQMTAKDPKTDNQSAAKLQSSQSEGKKKKRKRQIRVADSSDSEEDGAIASDFVALEDNNMEIDGNSPSKSTATPKAKRLKRATVISSDEDSEKENEVDLNKGAKRISQVVLSSDSEDGSTTLRSRRSPPSAGTNMISEGKVAPLPGDSDVNDDKAAFSMTSEDPTADDESLISFGLRRELKGRTSFSVDEPSPDKAIDVDSDAADDQKSGSRRRRKIRLVQSDEDE